MNVASQCSCSCPSVSNPLCCFCQACTVGCCMTSCHPRCAMWHSQCCRRCNCQNLQPCVSTAFAVLGSCVATTHIMLGCHLTFLRRCLVVIEYVCILQYVTAGCNVKCGSENRFRNAPLCTARGLHKCCQIHIVSVSASVAQLYILTKICQFCVYVCAATG